MRRCEKGWQKRGKAWVKYDAEHFIGMTKFNRLVKYCDGVMLIHSVIVESGFCLGLLAVKPISGLAEYT